MRKKLLLLTMVALCSSTMAFAHPDCGKCPPPPSCGCCHRPECCPPKAPKVNIEEKLKLSETQKAKAKELRMATREQMRPIMQAIRTKQEQKEIIKRNRNLTAEAQCAQVEKLNSEIGELQKQAHDLRCKNEKDFEALLTPKQKKEFNKLRQERIKNFKKCCPNGCPPPRR